MSEPATESRRFTLDEARAVLPIVRERTADAVERATRLSSRLDEVPDDDARATALRQELQAVVEAWAREMATLGVVVKGLWLVDFDNGDGYYCWKYPETAVDHYHSYEDGFSGRMKIV